MTEKQRDKPEPRRPPAEFGLKAIELAESKGRSKADIAKATGRSNLRTLDRLASGKGSVLFALEVLRVLRDWGIDVSQLPPLDESHAAVPEPLREWLALGERLRALATSRRFDDEVTRIRRLVEAHELVRGDDEEAAAPPAQIAKGTGDEHPRYTPRRRG